MAISAFCYRHPAQTARRNCFQCRHSICENCLIKLDHHLFCGTRCHEIYLQEIARETKRSIARYTGYATVILLFGGLIYFGLLADTFYNGSNHQSTSNLKSLALSLPVNVEENTVPQITISKPLNGETSSERSIQVEGVAPENSDVFLYLNGTLLEKTNAHANRYRFSHISLTKGANVIQTRYFISGSSEASTAIMIFYKD
jgi:endogenous inhibitor of DNA gyrase (YacG/DUF329 family)